jgi:hypothetical protein
MTELTAIASTSKESEVTPPSRLNLSSLEHIRREASKVYRDMRAGLIEPQDGSRLTYVLIAISKMFEVEETQQQLNDSTVVDDSLPISVLDGIDLDKLTEKELIALEVAVNTLECMRKSKLLPDP